jgi:hypothetical protein
MHRLTPSLTVLALGAALAAPVSLGAPVSGFVIPPPRVGQGPPNGDFAQGVAGWQTVGPRPPEVRIDGRDRFVRLGVNTTLVSSPVRISRRAQSMVVYLRSPQRGGLLLVRALRADGRQVTLGNIRPGAAFRRREVGLGPVRGSTVRIVLDPVTALGRSVDVRKVGPQRVLAPSWLVARGAPERIRRGEVRVATGRLAMRSARFRPPSTARRVTLEARGHGVVRMRIGGRRATLRASVRGWRTLAVPVTGGRPVRVTVVADPGAAELRLRRIAVVRS